MIIKKYQQQGLDTEYGIDKPNKVYEPHSHEKTYLFTLSGSLEIKIECGDWLTLTGGMEYIINENQLHEARVEPSGWEYIAAWKG